MKDVVSKYPFGKAKLPSWNGGGQKIKFPADDKKKSFHLTKEKSIETLQREAIIKESIQGCYLPD